ncbi:MAG TPA: hypothetical protein VLD57_12920 [Blastocatellia bacterium]|nr:hypothetical protein [Blastocatellia bacterium]
MNVIWRRPKITVAIALLLSPLLLYISLSSLRGVAGGYKAVVTRFATEDGTSYGPATQIARLENMSVKESSGVAASRTQTSILWTHNDSGDGPFIYAFDRQGRHRGVWKVAGAQAIDWEDMAIGPGPDRRVSYIYIGDIGDNAQRRDHVIIYRVAEPRADASSPSSTTQSPLNTAAAEVFRLRYADGKHDAETLMVHPTTGDLYIVTKVMGGAAGIYKLKAPFFKTGISTLARVGEVRFPNAMGGFITGGDISPDGQRVILCDYLGACEIRLPKKRGVAFDEIWKQSLTQVDVGSRRQGEAICYRADGLALLATSEGVPCPLIEVSRSQKKR